MDDLGRAVCRKKEEVLGQERGCWSLLLLWFCISFCPPSPHAAAAKSLQSCLTLWDPTDGSPPSYPVPGIFQARKLEWVAIAFSAISSRTHRKWGNHELGSHQQTGHQGLLFRSFSQPIIICCIFCWKEHWKGWGLPDHRIQILMVNGVIHFPRKWCCMEWVTNILISMKPMIVFWDLKTSPDIIHILISNWLVDTVTISRTCCLMVKSVHSGQTGFGLNLSSFTYDICDFVCLSKS